MAITNFDKEWHIPLFDYKSLKILFTITIKTWEKLRLNQKSFWKITCKKYILISYKKFKLSRKILFRVDSIITHFPPSVYLGEEGRGCKFNTPFWVLYDWIESPISDMKMFIFCKKQFLVGGYYSICNKTTGKMSLYRPIFLKYARQ